MFLFLSLKKKSNKEFYLKWVTWLFNAHWKFPNPLYHFSQISTNPNPTLPMRTENAAEATSKSCTACFKNFKTIFSVKDLPIIETAIGRCSSNCYSCLQIYWKSIPLQVFSSKFFEIFKSRFFTEHLLEAASAMNTWCTTLWKTKPQTQIARNKNKMKNSRNHNDIIFSDQWRDSVWISKSCSPVVTGTLDHEYISSII